MTAALLAVSEYRAEHLVGWLIVVGCLVGAAVVAYRSRDAFVPLLLCAVAVIAAVLLL